jgi:glucan phosphoethanolaminetransferase (alkaline phosphatase superfamily)
MRPTTSQPANGVSQAAGSRAPGSRARGRRARRSRGLTVAYLLAAATAAALVIDAVVHFQDAYFYDANTGALLSQGQLFRIQAVLAFVAALGVLVFPRRWPAWLFAALVAGSAAAAVIAYTYIDIGALAGLPNMYEPSWGPPGKLASAIAEIAGALLALAGLVWALAMRRWNAPSAPSTRARDEEKAPGAQR